MSHLDEPNQTPGSYASCEIERRLSGTISSLDRLLRIALAAPLVFVYWLTDQRQTIDADYRRWQAVADAEKWPSFPRTKGAAGMLELLGQHPAFRTLFYYRVGRGSRPARALARLLRTVYRGQVALYLSCDEIGAGLYIAHGFSTILLARRIGENCRVHQNVTLGWDDRNQAPVIGDDVTIYTGAVIVGGVTVGDGAVVGANAVVVKDVPAGMMAAGVPAVNRPLRDTFAHHRLAGGEPVGGPG